MWCGQLGHYSSLQLDLIIFKVYHTKRWLKANICQVWLAVWYFILNILIRLHTDWLITFECVVLHIHTWAGCARVLVTLSCRPVLVSVVLIFISGQLLLKAKHICLNYRSDFELVLKVHAQQWCCDCRDLPCQNGRKLFRPSLLRRGGEPGSVFVAVTLWPKGLCFFSPLHPHRHWMTHSVENKCLWIVRDSIQFSDV